jgi:signal transduction histidine kinase
MNSFLDIYTWSVLITGIFFTSFGTFAYLKNPKGLQNRLYGLFSTSFALWSYSFFLLLILSDSTNVLFFSRLLALGSTIIPVFYLHWVLSILGINKKRKGILFVSYIITGVFALFSFTDLYIPTTQSILFFPAWPVAGPLYKTFIILGYGVLTIYASIELFRGFISSVGIRRHRIGYLLLGTLLGFGGGATNFPLMLSVDTIQPFGIFGIMASPFIFSYAALKYKLFNIKIIATQFFIGAINVFFLINLLTAETPAEQFVDGILFVAILVFSFLLSGSVKREIQAREEIEKLAKDLEKANKRLTELDQLKSEFLSIASHQMRSPLTAIKGYASLILEGTYGTVSESVQQVVDKMFQSTESMIGVVEGFLNVSRIEQGRMQYTFQKEDLKKLVEQVVGELKPLVDEKGLTLSFSAEKEEYSAKIDNDKLKQVFVNIIDNAVKYTPKGSIYVTMSRQGEIIRAQIKDTGVGITSSDIKKLFHRFSRAEGASKVNTKGTGLGLYVAKEMVAAHKGEVWVESEGKGKGSTFFIEIPAV